MLLDQILRRVSLKLCLLLSAFTDLLRKTYPAPPCLFIYLDFILCFCVSFFFLHLHLLSIWNVSWHTEWARESIFSPNGWPVPRNIFQLIHLIHSPLLWNATLAHEIDLDFQILKKIIIRPTIVFCVFKKYDGGSYNNMTLYPFCYISKSDGMVLLNQKLG